MAEVLFKEGKIQVGDRVKIPKAIIDTLNIKQGQKILIKFNPEKREITIKEDKKKRK